MPHVWPLAAQACAFGGRFFSSCVGYAPILRDRIGNKRWLGTITSSRVTRTGLGPTKSNGDQQHLRCMRESHNQAGAASPLPPFDHSKRFRFTQPPCPDWQYGDGMKLSDSGQEEETLWGASEEAQKRKTWDLESTSSKETYQLLTSAIVPRPIAFVSTMSEDGTRPNLAPFSYFSMISHNPPLLSVSFALSQRRPKDSRENILETKQFTVNIISEPFIEAANSTSVESPANMNEWLLSGLTPAPSVLVKPPIVEESAVSMECELYSYQNIPDAPSVAPTTTLVLGLIKRVHVRERFLREDGFTLDPARLRPVARLGSVSYAQTVEGFELPRVSWKATKGVYEGIKEGRGKDGK